MKSTSVWERTTGLAVSVTWLEVDVSTTDTSTVKCEVCWHLFATIKLYEEHKCLGEDHWPGGKCHLVGSGCFHYRHFDSLSIPFREVPDVKCELCWHLFATTKLYEEHKCLGEDHRPGGK
ncbi:hypothetical protein PYW07_012723 [Mythimna separata]|uniref:Uncharacterized protein n=1 Tax=Mythimna separata TaxID=271217 RepID=A0AAD7Y8P7_MYTSE|nr:hypothetical protein PYW07_012723 [Mythimna separata]